MPLIRTVSPKTAAEAPVVFALALAALGVGAFAYRYSLAQPAFYQKDFGPAVMVAIGESFRQPLPAPDTPLAEFLAVRRDTLDRNDALPICAAETERASPGCLEAPNQFQLSTRYLMVLVGYWWKLAGISWTNIAWVAGALHALAVVSVYAIFRLWLPVVPAIAGAAFICVSAFHLSFVPHIRDYSKGAFILAAIPLLVLLALRPMSRRRQLWTAAAAGAVIGIGFGFKMDVAIMIPLTVIFLVLFGGAAPWSRLGEKALATAVFLFAFVVAAGPILFSMSRGGSNLLHVVLLGYSAEFDTVLGVEPSVYRFMPHYNDTYLLAATRAREALTTGRWLEVPSAEYDASGERLFTQIVRHFPADALTRTLAATGEIVDLAFAHAPLRFQGAELPLQTPWRAANEALTRWKGLGPPLAGCLIVLATVCRGFREGLFAALLLLALAGYPSLQFARRNYFHLQFISVLALVLLACALGYFALYAKRYVWRPHKAAGPGNLRPQMVVLRSLGALLMIGVITISPLAVLRAYQTRHIEAELDEFLAEPRTLVDPEFVSQGHNLWLVRWPDVRGRAVPGGPLYTAYYIVEFKNDGPRGLLAVGLRYRSSAAYTDFSRIVSLSTDGGVARLGFRVYSMPPDWEFEGLELGDRLRQQLAGVYRVERVGPIDLPIEFRLPGSWKGRPLFQRLVRERWGDLSRADTQIEAPGVSWSTQVATLDYVAGRSLAGDLEGIDRIYSPYVTMQGRQITMNGIAESQSAYLVQFKPVVASSEAVLFVEGTLHTGGIAIGLLENDQWAGQVAVNQPGNFVAIVPVAGASTFVPLISNALATGERENRFVITRVALVDPGAGEQ